VVVKRRAGAYVVANIWELSIAGGYFVQTILYLALPTLMRHTPISRAFHEPLDAVLTASGLVSSGAIIGGTLYRRPRIRAAGLALLAGVIAVRVIASFAVYGWVLGVYSLPLSLAAMIACLTRMLGIIHAGDYPPPASPPFTPWER
jgi:hypothetical protein